MDVVVNVEVVIVCFAGIDFIAANFAVDLTWVRLD